MISVRAKVQKGFTIVELLIAMTAFTFIMLLITVSLFQITRVFIKGFTTAQTQQVGRSLLDGVSQDIQFAGGQVVSPASYVNNYNYVVCVGDQRYSVLLGKQLTDSGSPSSNQANHVLVVDTFPNCNSGTPPQSGVLTASSRELLNPNMRLTAFTVTTSDSRTYQIHIRVVYGDDDLLCSPSIPGECTGSGLTPNAIDLTCRAQPSGSQFCAFSDFSTTVLKRV